MNYNNFLLNAIAITSLKILESNNLDGQNACMIKVKINHPSEVREILSRFNVPIYIAERCVASYNERLENNLVGTWWFSVDPKEIFDDIFTLTDVNLYKAQNEQFAWYLSALIDCEGNNWAEYGNSLKISDDITISKDEALARCPNILLKIIFEKACPFDTWMFCNSSDQSFETYLKDWEEDIAV